MAMNVRDQYAVMTLMKKSKTQINNILYSLDRGINIFKMFTLPKVIYIFNKIVLKIPMILVTKNRSQKILNS